MQDHLAENIIEMYRKHGRAWTELRGDILYEKSWLDLFRRHLSDKSTILDLGCGSGRTIANFFIQHGHKVIGVDSSETMIDMAKQGFPEQNWICQDMRTVDVAEKIDGILAWDSFFHLTPDDQRKMFSQFSRHARLGTVLMFTSGPSHGEAIGELFGDALYHASLAVQEYQALLHQYGFQVIRMVVEDIDCTGHTVWLAQRVEITG